MNIRVLINKISSHKYTSEAIWVLTGQITGIISGFLLLKLLTNLLTIELFGQLNLITVGIILPTWLLFAPFSQSALRMYSSYKENEKDHILISNLFVCYSCASTVIILLFLIVLFLNISSRFLISNVSLLLIIIMLLIEAWKSLFFGLLAADRKRKVIAGLTVLDSLCRPIIAYFFVKYFEANLEVILMALNASSILILFISVRSFSIKKISFSLFDVIILKDMLRYGLPFGFAAMLNWFQSYVERYVLSLQLGIVFTGPYAAGFQLATFPFNTASTFICTLISPIAYEIAGDAQNKERVNKSKRIIVIVTSCFAITGILMLPIYVFWGADLIKLLSNPKYIVGTSVLLFMALGALVKNTAQIFQTFLLVKNRTDLVFYVFLMSGVLSPFLSYFLISRLQLLGASLANLIASIIFLCSVLFVTLRSGSAKFKS